MEDKERRLEIKRLPNGTLILSESAIILIHDIIIEDRKAMGKNDPTTIRDPGVIRHIYDTLTDRPHKYKTDPRENALYVATETFYYIACEHPFTEGNKSTAYICALFLLSINLLPREEFILDSTPKEAEEIVRLAEGGKDPNELRRLIKEFLLKEISGKHG
ncbi:MAG: Fic family protein [Candidatus Micrarchaeota archaeon]